MKYIDSDTLKKEVERRRKFHDDAVIKFCNNRTIALTHSAGLKEDDEVLSLIDSLQHEQPEVDLEEEVKSYIKDNFTITDEAAQIPEEDRMYSMGLDDMVAFAKHFYGLGKARKEK